MPFDDLRQWIAALDRAGELKRIQTEADPILEIAEITDRVSKSKIGKPGGPALLFQNIKGHPNSQLLINQFGSEARMKLALGVNSFDEFADRIKMFLDVKSPQGFLDKLKMLPLLTEAGKFFPKTIPTGPCKEVIKHDNFSLLDFPILQCWPQDAGRFITLPCVVTRDPKSGKRNVGMYRLQVYDATTTGAHWQRQKVAAEHYRQALRNAAGATDHVGTSTGDGRTAGHGRTSTDRVGTGAFARPASEASQGDIDVPPGEAVDLTQKGNLILSVTENGYGKRTPADEYRLTNRGKKGVINVKTTERVGKVVAIALVDENSQVMLISQYGKIIRMDSKTIRESGRNAQGVRLLHMEPGDRVAAAVVLAPEEEGNGNGGTLLQ